MRLSTLLFLGLTITYIQAYGRTSQAKITRIANNLENGDFIFQNLDCGPLCDAIEQVTDGIYGMDFSHVGLVYRDGDSLKVIEAIGSSVRLTPITVFLSRSIDSAGYPKICIGRVKKQYKSIQKKAIQNARTMIGTPYDDLFLYGNDKLYCSELIYDAFKKANKDIPFFELQPMTFKDPSTHTFFPAWMSYYENLHHPIPEGDLGINPGALSKSKKLVIITLSQLIEFDEKP